MAEDKSAPEEETKEVLEDETVEESSPETGSETTSDETPKSKETTAKAGKRSAKSLKEEAEKAAKEERKSKIAKGEIDADQTIDKKGPEPVRRPKIERRSRKYQDSAKLIDAEKEYELSEAIDLAKKTSKVKFDASIELHVNLNVDPRHAEQNIRESVILPNGTGKSLKVAVFAPSSDHKIAKDAGADIVGEEDFLDLLKKEQLDFDVLIAPPQVMSKLGQFAKLLGPKGLMPNPKSGTVTKDIAGAVKEAKQGRIDIRVDEGGVSHNLIGKVSFDDKKLLENAETVLSAIKGAKPSAIKGQYIQTISVSSAMGPGIKVKQ